MSGKVRDGIVKRGRTWSYVVRVPDPDTGKTRPRWVGGFATEGEAKAARDAARVAARRGDYVDRSTVTVAQYLTDWLAGHAVAVKPSTHLFYKEKLTRYVIPRIGSMRLQAVRPATLSALYRELLDGGGTNGQPLAASTVTHVHRACSKAFNDAVTSEGLLASNPAQRAKRPRAQTSEPLQVWTPAQLRTFLDVASGHRLGAYFRLAAYTGARRGELLNARWHDLDMDAREWNVTGTTNVIDGQRVNGSTKAGRGRVVSLDAGTVDVLRAHRRAQAAERLLVGSHYTGDGSLVFAQPTGEPLHPDTMSSLMGKLVTAARLPRARLHDLRHLHATTLLLAGVPVHVVAARLGHADPSITLRVYAHVLREQSRDVAQTFADVLDGAR